MNVLDLLKHGNGPQAMGHGIDWRSTEGRMQARARLYEAGEEIIALRRQLAGAVEDAKDAGEASMQAAFWRARAIELGASEDEYRRHVGGQ